MATRYIPPGWTEEMLTTATPEQWDALTPEEYRKVCEFHVQEGLAMNAAHATAIAAEVAAKGIHIQTEYPARFVEVIRTNYFHEWGFVVVRATYEDEDRWTHFRELWVNAMNAQMTSEHGGGIDEVRANLTFEWVEDPALDGRDMEGVRFYMQNWFDHRELPPGVVPDVCLVVTKEAIESLLSGSTSAAFIIALDTETPEDEEEEYPGHFKVAISSVLDEFFPVLTGYDLTMKELSPLEGEIWSSITWMFHDTAGKLVVKCGSKGGGCDE